jgi:hypothetical protein
MLSATRLWKAAVLAGVAVVVASCSRQAEERGSPAAGGREEVVVYTALDRQFSEPILSEFTAKTGIEARAVYDTESTKTVGLAIRSRRTTWTSTTPTTICTG